MNVSFVHKPKDIIEQHKRHADRALDVRHHEFILLIAAVVLVAVAVFLAYACGFGTSKRQRTPATLSAIMFWPNVLDSVFGGNRTREALYPYKQL